MMKQSANAEKALLLARVEDLFCRAERYEPCVGPFLTPAEQFFVSGCLPKYRSDAFAVFFGGYDGSERNRLFVLPGYLADESGEYPSSFVRTAVPELAAEAVSVLAVAGSGYKKLTHRDYLGSLLALGIERDKVGDIVVTDDAHAYIFCDGTMATFLTQELHRVGSDAVKVESVEIGDDFHAERRFIPISATVASPRLDSIVAALIGTSREKAQTIIREGAVEVNYEMTDRNDKLPGEGAVIRVRGHGKYVLRSVSEQTKKGRYRLLADQYD